MSRYTIIAIANEKYLCALLLYRVPLLIQYSGTSEERTLWERHFCPLFGGCPLLGGCLIFALYTPLE